MKKRHKDGFLELNKENLVIHIHKKYSELVKIFGYNENLIRKVIKEFGLKKPLKREPKIPLTKENVEKYFIIQNKKLEDVLKIFGCSSKIFYKALRKYSIKKPAELSNIIRKKTCLEKYGVDVVSKSKFVLEKMKQTNLQKYGKEYYFQSEIGKNNIKYALKEKYGIDNISQRHIDKDCLLIFNDKERLKKFILENNVHSAIEMSNITGYHVSSICKKLLKYDLRNIIIPSTSFPEQQLRNYIGKFFDCIYNSKILGRKEIDIYIPKLKLGIEFNGNYWHGELKRQKEYHQEKSLLAESKGIFIYHIFEYEWKTKKEQIINQLNNLLGINQEKIYARKCEIKEVSTKEKESFLNKNHLQANDSSSIKIGLYYNDELVSLMTFQKNINNMDNIFKLSRFCSKANCNVIGGVSKLFKYFIDTYKPKSIISYSNIAHTKGKIYKTLGFEQMGISIPSFIYYNNAKTPCKIYDCGNKIWAWSENKIKAL